jgi:hypothetical protein
LEGIRQSAGWPRAASTQPDLPHPGPRGRQGRPAAHPPSPPGEKRPTGHGRPIPSRSRRTECRRRPRTEGTGAGRDRGRPGPRWVRAASETAGHRRARAGTAGEPESQVTGHSPQRPQTTKQHGAGFEPLTRAGLLLPRDVSDFTCPALGLPEIAVGALVPERVQD